MCLKNAPTFDLL